MKKQHLVRAYFDAMAILMEASQQARREYGFGEAWAKLVRVRIYVEKQYEALQ